MPGGIWGGSYLVLGGMIGTVGVAGALFAVDFAGETAAASDRAPLTAAVPTRAASFEKGATPSTPERHRCTSTFGQNSASQSPSSSFCRAISQCTSRRNIPSTRAVVCSNRVDCFRSFRQFTHSQDSAKSRSLPPAHRKAFRYAKERLPLRVPRRTRLGRYQVLH